MNTSFLPDFHSRYLVVAAVAAAFFFPGIAVAQFESEDDSSGETDFDDEPSEDSSGFSTSDDDPIPESSPPPPASTAREEEDEFDGGLYIDVNVAGTLGIRSTHQWKESCPEVTELSWSPDCKTKPPMGVALEGRIGVRIGVVGIEGFGLAAGDWSGGKLQGQEPAVPLPSFATEMAVGRIGGGVGGGLRLTSTGLFRIALGAGGGVMFRHVYSNVSSLDGSSQGYVAPIVRADLSLTLLKFLNIGVLGWVEFSPEVIVTLNLAAAGGIGDVMLPPAQVDALEGALGDVTVFDGPQFFVGPFAGFHFGS
jgi:hypothetical protein